MIVTTFSPQGYEQYGKRFIETYRKYCPYPLTVYVEDDLKIDGVDTRNLFDVPGCSKFLEIIGEFDSTKHPKKNNYRWNANKFCRKVFAITDFGMNYKGIFTFLGADTYFLKDMPEGFLEELVPEYIAYIGRTRFHSETDYIGFDTNHKMNNLFMRLFIREYTSGAFQSLESYCDSDVFDHLRVLLGVPANNLNVIDEHYHPFINTVLGEYLDHPKGLARKVHGKSFERDYIDKRRIPV